MTELGLVEIPVVSEGYFWRYLCMVGAPEAVVFCLLLLIGHIGSLLGAVAAVPLCT